MLPFQNTPGLGYVTRMLTSEVIQVAHVAASSALGRAETRPNIYLGDCATRDSGYALWCARVPTAGAMVRDCSIGAMPLTGLMSLALALLPPERFAPALPVAFLVNHIASPLFFGPTGCAIGAAMFHDGDVRSGMAGATAAGGATIIGLELGGLLILGVLASAYTGARARAVGRCLKYACCGAVVQRTAAQDLELAQLPQPIVTEPMTHAALSIPAAPSASVPSLTEVAPAYIPGHAPPIYNK